MPVALLTVTVVPLGPWRPVAEGCVYCLGLAAAVVAVRRHHTPLALSWWGVGTAMVLFTLVDDFKAVNDSRGHAAGDEMLVAIARRLAGCVRADDVVARLGGDEFAVLLPATRRDELGEVADRVLASLRAPLQLTSGAVTVTVSVGGALGAPGCTAEALLQCADTAMYAAKRAGKNAGTLLDMAQAELVL